MRRVVISGIGVVSCLCNSKEAVLDSLREGRSGISFNESFKEMGLRSQVCGSVDIDTSEYIDRRVRRFMGDAAAYAYISMQQAIDDAGLESSDISNPSTGLIAGSGGASTANVISSADITRERGVKKIGPFMVPRTMGSTVSACLATPFKITIQNQGPQLLSDVCLCDQRTLRWHRNGTDPVGQTGSDICRRRRRGTLVPLRSF
jgi:3-oxoacyl-[acyl-carrier-protein] synthase-1